MYTFYVNKCYTFLNIKCYRMLVNVTTVIPASGALGAYTKESYRVPNTNPQICPGGNDHVIVYFTGHGGYEFFLPGVTSENSQGMAKLKECHMEEEKIS